MTSRYKIFMKVLECRSFSIASKEIGYSQSAVSQAMKSLEEELQTTLFKRNREGIQLTKDGEDYLPYIRSISLAEDLLYKKMCEKNGLEDEVIRIGTFTSVSRNLLPKLLSDFHALYPGIHFELRQGEYDNIHEWIRNGEVDFAFINPKDFDDIDIDVIYHDYMLAVLPVGHRLCKKASVHLKDLCDDPFILLDEGKNSVPLDAFHQYDLQPSIAYKVYDDYSILAMVKQNMGISMMYGLVVRDFENNVVIKPIQENVERTSALACLKKEYLSKASKQLYEYIQKNVTKILEDGLLKHEK